MRRFFRSAAVLAALICLVLATAAPRMGGGFGGGRSSFGGGRSSFGGGSSGRSSWGGSSGRSNSWGGGSRSTYGGGFRPMPIFIPFGIGGPRGSGQGILTLLGIIAGVVVLGVAGAAAAQWWANRCSLVNVGFRLRKGAVYSRRLDSILDGSEVGTVDGRVKALHRLVKQIEPADILDSYVMVPVRHGGSDKVGMQAEDQARTLMDRLGVTPETVNVADEDGQSVQVTARAGRDASVGDTDGCVLSLLLGVRARNMAGFKPSGAPEDAVVLLNMLEALPGRDLAALYTFYTPNAGVRMDPNMADRVFLDMKALAQG